jgi:hypothetical protein
MAWKLSTYALDHAGGFFVTHAKRNLDAPRLYSAPVDRDVASSSYGIEDKVRGLGFGARRLHANRRYRYALSLIAWRLNGRKVPMKRSREFLVEKSTRFVKCNLGDNTLFAETLFSRQDAANEGRFSLWSRERERRSSVQRHISMQPLTCQGVCP